MMRRLPAIILVLFLSLDSFAQSYGLRGMQMTNTGNGVDSYSIAWNNYITSQQRSFSRSMSKPADIPDVISIMVSDTTFLLKDQKTLEYYMGRVRPHPISGGRKMLMLQHGHGISRQWLDSSYVYHIGVWKRGFLHGPVITVLSGGEVSRVDFSWGRLDKDSLCPVSEAEEESARKKVARLDAAIRAMQGHMRK